jgi:hypothetical protein
VQLVLEEVDFQTAFFHLQDGCVVKDAV